MGIKAVRAYLKSLEVVPPVPSEKNMAAQKNPLQINAVPPVPSVPSKNTDSRDVFQPLPPSSSERRDPNDWRELAKAYHRHHFKCVVYIAAGRGSGYGPRCGAGAALWVAYQDAPLS